MKDDAGVAEAARRFVAALKLLEAEGGDHALLVNQRRQELEGVVNAEATNG